MMGAHADLAVGLLLPRFKVTHRRDTAVTAIVEAPSKDLAYWRALPGLNARAQRFGLYPVMRFDVSISEVPRLRVVPAEMPPDVTPTPNGGVVITEPEGLRSKGEA
jgi:hypothetical protein